MFQLLLFVGSVIAFVIGGLVVLIGMGVIAGCTGGLLVMFTGGIIAFFGIWSVVTFLLPRPAGLSAKHQTINLIKTDSTWA
jgi:uncharacterized membrane protein YedE/YeeE